MPQKSRQLELPIMSRGEAPRGGRSVEASTAARGSGHPGDDGALMERVVFAREPESGAEASEEEQGQSWHRRDDNGGASAVPVGELGTDPRGIARGTYQPSALKRQEIPKSSGGVRQLGIPTVLDRFIQQALLQVLQPGFDAGFSGHSYGFRPRRSAHDAVMAVRRYVQEARSRSWQTNASGLGSRYILHPS